MIKGKKGQSMLMEVLIALAMVMTGGYITYYAATHYDMQCNIIGNNGYWCILVLALAGIILVIAGIYGVYAMIRGRSVIPNVV